MVKQFLQHGWTLSRIQGSHHILKSAKGSTAVIPVHGNKDLHIGIQNRLLAQLKEEEERGEHGQYTEAK